MLETFALRLRTWWHRDELDEQLEHGAQPAIGADTMLAYRAAQLRRRSTRNTLAAALEDAVREAHKAWSVSARLPLARAEVRACADDLVALALRLRADEPDRRQGRRDGGPSGPQRHQPALRRRAGHAALRRAARRAWRSIRPS